MKTLLNEIITAWWVEVDTKLVNPKSDESINGLKKVLREDFGFEDEAIEFVVEMVRSTPTNFDLGGKTSGIDVGKNQTAVSAQLHPNWDDDSEEDDEDDVYNNNDGELSEWDVTLMDGLEEEDAEEEDDKAEAEKDIQKNALTSLEKDKLKNEEISDKLLKTKLTNPTTGNPNQVSTLLGKKKTDKAAYNVAKQFLGDKGISDDDIEKQSDTSTDDQPLKAGKFDPQQNQESLDSFIEVGFGNSKGAPGSAGSMLNEIVSISSATDSFNSGKPFDYDSQLEKNINKLKGSGLADENDSSNPPSGVTIKEARAISEKYGVSIGLAGKCIIATRAAKSKNNHITEKIVKVNKLENPKAIPFFGDKNGLKSQEEMINSTTGRVLLGNTEVSKEEAIKIIKSGGGGNNPSDTAIFITDEKTGDTYMTFYSDKDNVNAIVAQSSLKAEGNVKKKQIQKLAESGKLTKEQSKKLESIIDDSIEEHERLESELTNVTTGPAKHISNQNPTDLVDIAKTASSGREPDKYWKKAVTNQLLGKKKNKAMLEELPEGHATPPTDVEMMTAFVKYANNPNSTLTNDQHRLISDMNKATNGPKIGAAIGEIRKKTIESDLKMLNKLNEETFKLDNGVEVGMGTYLEAESIVEKLHLKMMFGGKGVYADSDSFYQESGGVKVDKDTLSKCMPFSSKNDMISHFEIGEERETTKRGSDIITGGSKIVYAITKEGEKYPIGEKIQRSKQGDLGKLSTVYNYSREIQKCFKKNG